MNEDAIEYVPMEQHSEGPKTFTFKVTIEPEGTPRVEMLGQDASPTTGRGRS